MEKKLGNSTAAVDCGRFGGGRCYHCLHSSLGTTPSSTPSSSDAAATPFALGNRDRQSPSAAVSSDIEMGGGRQEAEERWLRTIKINSNLKSELYSANDGNSESALTLIQVGRRLKAARGSHWHAYYTERLAVARSRHSPVSVHKGMF